MIAKMPSSFLFIGPHIYQSHHGCADSKLFTRRCSLFFPFGIVKCDCASCGSRSYLEYFNEIAYQDTHSEQDPMGTLFLASVAALFFRRRRIGVTVRQSIEVAARSVQTADCRNFPRSRWRRWAAWNSALRPTRRTGDTKSVDCRTFGSRVRRVQASRDAIFRLVMARRSPNTIVFFVSLHKAWYVLFACEFSTAYFFVCYSHGLKTWRWNFFFRIMDRY
jgi:hypothetical protein